jgi:hypothetical protein
VSFITIKLFKLEVMVIETLIFLSFSWCKEDFMKVMRGKRMLFVGIRELIKGKARAFGNLRTGLSSIKRTLIGCRTHQDREDKLRKIKKGRTSRPSFLFSYTLLFSGFVLLWIVHFIDDRIPFPQKPY